MKKITLMLSITMALFGWEINTHRAIDKEAILKASNLEKFKENSQIKEPFDEDAIQFQTYGMTYIEYIMNGEKGGMSEWGQKFSDNKGKKAKINDLLEAGTILEDAVWAGAAFNFNGRFNNHFCNPQDDNKGLTWGYGHRENAINWAKHGSMNSYSFDMAQRWFLNGFSLPKLKDRRYYQAKMLVSVGHLMHMLNDMNVPAHTRDDSHPFGDPLEVWMRGGQGKDDTGFYVRGKNIVNKRYSTNSIVKYSKFVKNMWSEAKYTSKNFFSKDTIPYKERLEKTPSPSMSNMTIPKLNHHPSYYNYITDNQGRKMAVVYWSHWFGLKKVTIDNSTISNPVHNDYGKALIPRAIANAAGFLNYFFRGSMKVNSTDEVVSVINDSNENLVASPSVVTFKKGTLKFYCDDENDNRSEFHSEDIADVTSVNELASVAKDTLYAEFKDKGCSTGKNVTILYDGTIGNERGLSVIVIPASDIIPSNDGGGDDSNGDNTGGDTDNGDGADNGDGSDNGDNNATDPTKDPNKVCVSNYFKYYGDGKIHETLKKGDKDAELYSDGTKHQVKELQEFLQAFGYDVGSSGADGWFGSDTESALMDFQSANGLDADGIVGPNTRDAMNSQNCYDK